MQKLISVIVIAEAKAERHTIFLRPMRSPTPPHTGEKTAEVNALADRMAPAQNSTLLSGCTPFSSKNWGKNGAGIVFCADIVAWTHTIRASVRFHDVPMTRLF